MEGLVMEIPHRNITPLTRQDGTIAFKVGIIPGNIAWQSPPGRFIKTIAKKRLIDVML